MGEHPQMTKQTLSILAVILEDPTVARYGLELGEAAGLKSGTLYPALARLERAGWLTSYWEDVEPREAGRPRRRMYEITGTGRACAQAALDEHLAVLRVRQPQRVAPKVLPA
jgi:PadR family transcriptional regulator, regulatory protein PadR